MSKNLENSLLCFNLQVFRDILRVARGQEAQVLVIATARNKQELNRELLTSQGTHTFDRVLEIEPPTLVSGNIAPTLSSTACYFLTLYLL